MKRRELSRWRTNREEVSEYRIVCVVCVVESVRSGLSFES